MKRLFLESHKGRDLGPTAQRLQFLHGGPDVWKCIPPGKWDRLPDDDTTPDAVRKTIAAWAFKRLNFSVSQLVDMQKNMAGKTAVERLAILGRTYYGTAR